MKDYYHLFVSLSLQQCTKDDYTNKNKVKLHNLASKKLHKLQNEMQQNVSKEILYMLLNHEDERVRVNAASLCLHKKDFIENSILILEEIINRSDDPTLIFSAKMLLNTVKH